MKALTQILLLAFLFRSIAIAVTLGDFDEEINKYAKEGERYISDEHLELSKISNITENYPPGVKIILTAYQNVNGENVKLKRITDNGMQKKISFITINCLLVNASTIDGIVSYYANKHGISHKKAISILEKQIENESVQELSNHRYSKCAFDDDGNLCYMGIIKCSSDDDKKSITAKYAMMLVKSHLDAALFFTEIAYGFL